MDEYYNEREKKEAYIEDLLKISQKHGYILRLEHTTDVIKPTIEDVDKFYNAVLWWRPDAINYK